MHTRKAEIINLIANKIFNAIKIQIHLDLENFNSDLASSHFQSCDELGRQANYLTISQLSCRLNANDSTEE